MSIRRNHKNANKSRAKNARLREKASRLVSRAAQSTLAALHRHVSRVSWWQRAFKVPLVGFYGRIRSTCSSLWAACLAIVGLKANKPSQALAARHGQVKAAKKAQTRQLLHETMEQRQLLAADVMVFANDTLAFEDPSTFNNQGQFTIKLDTAATGTGAEVVYTLTGEANSENPDYDAIVSSKTIGASGTITIAAGQTSAVVDIDVIDDDLYDGGDEEVIFTIVSATDNGGAIGVSGPTDKFTITDNDAVPTVSITATDGSAAEPADTGEFTITQTGKSDADTTAAITYSGTAHPTDFTAATSATVKAGTTSASVTVTPTSDTLVEGTESVIAKLGALTANKGIATVAPTSAQVDIADTQDKATIFVQQNDLTASENATDNANVSIAHFGQSSTETVVQYEITGDAVEGTDYTSGNQPEYNAPNNTVSGPQAGDGPQGLAGFSLAPNPNIANATTVPHVTVFGNGTADSGTADVYAFYTDSGGASVFDIDNTTGGFNSFLEVIDSTGAVIASNDGGGSDTGSPASTTDSRVSVNLPAAGIYYVRVTNGTAAASTGTKAGASAGSATGATAAQTYELNISVPGAQNYATLGSGGLPSDAETRIYFDVNPGFDDSIVEPTEKIGIEVKSIVMGDPQISLSTTPGALEADITITDNDKATVSIAGTKNAAEPGTNGEFTFTLTGGTSSTDTKLKWTLDDPNSTTKSGSTKTADDPADHSLADFGYVTIAAGKTQATLTVPVIDSSLIEEDETLTIDFTIDTADPDIGTGITEAAIKFGDEDTATVDVDAKVAPASEDGTDGKFVFFLSEPPGYPTGTPGMSDRDTVITYEITGTAMQGVDYTKLSATTTGTVTIPAFKSSAEVVIDAIDDMKLEGTETVTLSILTLESPTDSNVTIGKGSPADTMNILDNDALTVKIEGTKNAFENGAPGEFVVSTVGTGETLVDTVVTYQVNVKASSAIEGTDFKALTGKVTIPMGVAPQSNTITIDAIDDAEFEGDETVTIEILSVAGGPGVTVDAADTATKLIIDDEPGDVKIVNLDHLAESADNGAFTIQLGGISTLPTIVQYEILGTGTATQGSDFSIAGTPGKYGQVTIPAFLTEATVPVSVINDNTAEPTETIDIRIDSILSGQKYKLGPDAQLNVYSDLNVSVKADPSAASESGPDGKFTLYLELDANGDPATSDQDTIVSYDILTGAANDATDGADYASLSGTATILKGQTSVDILVDVTDDSLLENTENVRLKLTGITSGEKDIDIAAGPDDEATVTIADNDFAYLTVKATKTPGEDNPGSDVDAEFTVFISQASDVATVVEYDVTGTATSGTDYTALTGKVTIPANQTSAPITVDVLDDTIIEGTETVTIDLKGPVTKAGGGAHPHADRIFLGALGSDYIGPGQANLSFQQGFDLGSGTFAGKFGTYSGTQDAFVQQSNPGVNFGVGDVEIDTDNFGGPATAAEHGLLKFEDIVGTDFGLIPAGTPILSADLNLVSFDGGPVIFHQLLADFDQNAITWLNAGLGGNVQPGIQADGVEAAAAGAAFGLTFGTNSVPATGLVQQWIDGSSGNFGWAILPGATLASASFEGSEDGTPGQRPELVVGLDVSATVSITDSDVAFVEVIDSASLDASEPATNGSIIVRLVDGGGNPVTSSSAVTVSYSDVTPSGPGFALSGSDYKALSGTVTIPAKATQAAIVITPNNDSLVEPQEAVNIEITKVASADPDVSKGADLTGTTNINDDDFGLVTITSSKDGDENTGSTPIDGEFVVTISTPSDTDTVVEIALSGSADEGADYNTIGKYITIPANSTKVTVPVEVIDDLVNETDPETVTLKLVGIKSGNASIFTSAPSTDTINIYDDEQTLEVSAVATDPTATEQVGMSTDDGELQIQLNWVSDQDTVVEYTISGTATDWKGAGGPDYDATQFPGVNNATITGASSVKGKITIPQGKTNAVFPVDVYNDFVMEGPETVVLTIDSVSNANGYKIAAASDTVTINDGKYEVSVEKTDSPAAEPGPAAGSNGQFTFTITNPLPEPTEVLYKVDAGSTATAGVDYTKLSGTITIPADQTQVTLDVDVIDDLLVEGDETVIVEITGASSTGALYTKGAPSVTFDATQATETIEDNDVATVSIAGFDGAEPSTNGKFVISQTLKSATDTVVTYKLDASTDATGGSDYDDTKFTGTQTATIKAGDTSVVISVPVLNDSEVEPTEQVVVDLLATKSPTDPQVTLGTKTATVNIADDDTATAFVVATDPNGFEPGTNDGIFTIMLDAPSATDTVVTFQIGAGTDATYGNDYILRDGSSVGPEIGSSQITIPAGKLSHTVVVDVLDDTIIEDLETVELQLTKTDNAKIGVNPTAAKVTINPDDDLGLVSIAGTTNANEAGSVAGEFTVTLDTISDEDTTVSYSITGGTATAVADYTLKAGTVVIPAFKTQATITVPVVDDSTAEVTETLEVTLGSVTKGHTGNISVDATKQVATIDILDDDASLLSISSPTVTEGKMGTTTKLEFVVTSPSAVSGGFTVDYKVADILTNMGAAPTDYTDVTPGAGTLTFTGTAGETEVVTLEVAGDNWVEADETVKVTLGATNKGILVNSGASGTGTITNDDTATFTITATDATGKASDYVVTEGSQADPTKAPWTDYKFKVSLDNPIDVATTVDIDFGNGASIVLDAQGGDFDPLLNLKAPNNKIPVGINGFDYDDDAGESKATISKVEFAAGSTADEYYTVRVVNDNIVEGGATGKGPGVETFTATLGDLTATRKTVTTDTATGTIEDDDSGEVYIDASASDLKASEPLDTVNEMDGQFVIVQTAVSSTDTVVTYSVTGTADHAGSDYTPLTGSATIKAGTTSVAVDVLVEDSAELEDDETVTIKLTGFSSVDPDITLSKTKSLSETVTIFDDDQAEVTVTASDAAASEDPLDDGEFTLTLSEVSDVDTIITYDILDSVSGGADGKATNGADYKLLSGTATIAAGKTTTTIAVEVVDDVDKEIAEDVILKITGFQAPTNADISVGAADTATVTIADDIDGILVNVLNNGDGSEATPAVNPGSFIFTITKEDGVTPVVAPAGGLEIQYSSLGGTATPGAAGDYIGLSGTVFIPAGQTQLVLDFTVNDDAAIEPTETVILTIQNLIYGSFPGGEPAAIGANPATVSILDNDSPAPQVESVELNGGDAQRSNLKTVTVTFDSDVTLDPTAFSVEKRSDTTVGAIDGTITTATGLIVGAPAVVSGKTVVELTFDSGAGNPLIDLRDSLVNGNYQIKIDATKVTIGTQQLDGDANGTGGDDYVYGDSVSDGFFAMYGDGNGDGIIDLADINMFVPTVGTADDVFDFDASNLIDLDDINAFVAVVGTARKIGGF